MKDAFYDTRIDKVANGTASAGTAINSSIIDMHGYTGVVFFTTIETANAGNFIKVQQDVDPAGGTMADLVGTKVIAASNNDAVAVHVKWPKERYLRAVVIRGGADTIVGEIYAIRYGGGLTKPESNNRTGFVGESHISPAEGTP